MDEALTGREVKEVAFRGFDTPVEENICRKVAGIVATMLKEKPFLFADTV